MSDKPNEGSSDADEASPRGDQPKPTPEPAADAVTNAEKKATAIAAAKAGIERAKDKPLADQRAAQDTLAAANRMPD